jgi:hypothetical protein
MTAFLFHVSYRYCCSTEIAGTKIPCCIDSESSPPIWAPYFVFAWWFSPLFSLSNLSDADGIELGSATGRSNRLQLSLWYWNLLNFEISKVAPAGLAAVGVRWQWICHRRMSPWATRRRSWVYCARPLPILSRRSARECASKAAAEASSVVARLRSGQTRFVTTFGLEERTGNPMWMVYNVCVCVYIYGDIDVLNTYLRWFRKKRKFLYRPGSSLIILDCNCMTPFDFQYISVYTGCSILTRTFHLWLGVQYMSHAGTIVAFFIS